MPRADSKHCGKHAPGIDQRPDFSASFFRPSHRDFEPTGTVAVECAEQFRIEREAILHKVVCDMTVVATPDHLGSALQVFAAQAEKQADYQQVAMVKKRTVEAFGDLGAFGALANSDHRLLLAAGLIDKPEQVIGADAAIGIGECEPGCVGILAPGFAYDRPFATVGVGEVEGDVGKHLLQ